MKVKIIENYGDRYFNKFIGGIYDAYKHEHGDYILNVPTKQGHETSSWRKEEVEEVNTMENTIFEQMQEIVKDESRWGTIFTVNDSHRGIGKSYNIDLIAQAYDLIVIKRNNHSTKSFHKNIRDIHQLTKGTRIILDELFSLKEIEDLEKRFTVVFALWYKPMGKFVELTK